MPKGIRKACANCIKARLACDDGRPCQRCIVHQCECVAVARKPRVKKQKLEHEQPPFLPSDSKFNIPSIDSNSDVVAPNWEFASGTFSTFTLERPTPVQQAPPAPVSTTPAQQQQQQPQPQPQLQQVEPPTITSPSRSPLFDSSSLLQLSPLNQLSPPMMQMSPLQMQPSSPPRSPSNGWAQATPAQARVESFTQQLGLPLLSPQQLSPQPMLTPPLQTPLAYEGQLFSMLMNDKASGKLLSDWQDTPVGTLIDGQVYAFDANNNPSAFKKLNSSLGSSSLPAPMNSTRLFPPPVAVFDKRQNFQLLDANEAMATFIGHINVGALSTAVSTMDDLLGPEASEMAKDAYTNFVVNPLACYPIGEVRTLAGNKTVEFNVDLTEQLLILTFKSVFDTYSMGLPEVPRMPVKSDVHFSSASQPCACKACEFLSPID